MNLILVLIYIVCFVMALILAFFFSFLFKETNYSVLQLYRDSDDLCVVDTAFHQAD